MKAFNTSLWATEGGYNGTKFTFEPGEEKEIWDINVITHLCNSLKQYGVVHLVYGDIQKKKYGDYTKFYRHQVLEGLGNLRKFKEEALRNEKQAMRDLSKVNGTEFDKTSMNPGRFEDQIKEIDKKVETLKAQWAEEDKDGSIDNKDTGETEVRRNKRKILD